MCPKVTTNSFGILLQNFLHISIPVRGRCSPYLRYINGTFLLEMSLKKVLGPLRSVMYCWHSLQTHARDDWWSFPKGLKAKVLLPHRIYI